MNIKTNKQSGFTLIEILIVIGLIAILATIVLIAINPARQFRLAHDSARASNVNAILNSIGQFSADKKGVLTTLSLTSSFKTIKDGDADICDKLVPTYMPALPVDPTTGTDGGNNDGQVSQSECTGNYDTKYRIKMDTNGRITVDAIGEETASISVTR